MEEVFHRAIKSFVLRSGRITKLQQHALDNYSQLYCIPYDADKKLDFPALFGNCNPTVIEIGFGDGEATYQMAERNPGMNYLAMDVYPPFQCAHSASRCRRGGGEHGSRRYSKRFPHILPGSLAEEAALQAQTYKQHICLPTL